MSLKSTMAGLAVLVAAALPLVVTPAAQADTDTVAVARSEVVSTAMTVADYDVAVANAHGYRVVLVGGKKTSVKVSDGPITQGAVEPASGGDLTTADNPVVSGNCGVSWMYYSALGSRKAQVYTGFDIWPTRAVRFTWKISVTDNAGSAPASWGYNINSWTWDADWTTTHSTTGYSWAEVTYGAAVLANGAVCVAGHPWQSTNLY
jgi:hypothetical protein